MINFIIDIDMENILELIGKLAAAGLGIWEIIARLWPTVNDWTIIGNILKFLKIISDFLNNKKKDLAKAKSLNNKKC